MRIPTSVVEFLAEHATSEEVEIITQTLKKIEADPALGFTIPFNLPELKDCFVYWTPDKKFRIMYQRKKTFGFSRLKLLRIDLE